MISLRAKITKSIPVQSKIDVCDNSGARTVKVISVKGAKTVRKRAPSAGVSDYVMVVITEGKPGMKKQVTPAIIVRQKKEYRRLSGERIKFEDNSCVILKDDKGNPKGTLIKGPIAKEVAERWPAVAKIASIVV